ncbi:MAG: SUMF1/EgtB/PvdO family nonheme iron enzyme, partial [Victivallales bacterium]|nr:SUMF1/EgtB/PvdO family nonheme iron enzyme [Victivallales bacterium]
MSNETVCPVGMVAIPAGEFWMGCNDSDSGSAEYDGSCSSYESPQHLVTTSAYCIDVTEVTNGAYAPFLTEHGNACATYECVDSDALSLQLEESAGT